MLKWKFENERLVVEKTSSGQVLVLGACEGLDGKVLADVLNAVPALAVQLVPPHFLEKP